MPEDVRTMLDGDTRDLLAYYSARVSEYEEIYRKPERQADLAVLRRTVADFAAGERVLELACGTGYWTRVMGAAAGSIHAVDLSRESLEVARRGAVDGRRITFERADLNTMAIDASRFSAVVSGFYWSHIPRQSLSGFVAGLAGRLRSGIRLLFFDNRYVEGSSSPIVDTDPEGNTYQMRRLASGDEFRILKNFPSRRELYRAVDGSGREVEVTELRYYWVLGFTV